MADLNVVVGADISQYKAGMTQAADIASTATGSVNNSLKQTEQEFKNLGNSAQSASMRFQQMRSGLSAVRDGTMAVFVGGQRADMMMMAMGHHFTSLINETGSLGGAFKALGASLGGAGGIILGLTLAYELCDKFAKSESDAYDATKNFTSAADAQHAVIQNLDSGYQEAVKNVYELTENVKLAKEGFIAKNEVVKEYNDTLGKTMGSVKTLDQVEQKLTAGAADYVKMMLYKAAAQTALKEASDKAVAAAKTQFESDEKALSFWDKTVQILGRVGSGGTGGSGAVNAGATSDQEAAKQAQDNRDKEKAAYIKDGNELLKIADDFQTKAATISSKNGWKFLDQEKVKEAKDGFAIIEAQLLVLQNKLEDAVMAKNPNKTLVQMLGEQIDALEEKLAKLKNDYATALQPHLNNIIPTNETTANSINAINEPLRSDSVDPGSVAAAVKAFKAEHDAIFSSYLATKQYNAENKEANQTLKELTHSIGTGLMQAFESALNGTQSFVSAMAQFLIKLIEKLIAAAAAAAILAIILNSISFGGATLASQLGSAGSFSGLFGQLSGLGAIGSGAVSSHASGGIFTKATIGQFAEAGPEAIVTPQHLADFAGVQSGNNEYAGSDRQLVGEISGSKLQLWMNRSAKTKGRTQ